VRYEVRPLGPWTDPVTKDRAGSGRFRAPWVATLDLSRGEQYRGWLALEAGPKSAFSTADETAIADRIGFRPGVYEDVPHEVYLADPALSSSGARRLLPPSCPAVFRWYADNPQPPKLDYDLGHAAHRELLGAGPGLVVVDAADWRTKAAREARDAAYDAGQTPLLRHQHAEVLAMVAAVRAHPVAGRMFQPEHGRSEVSCWWDDSETGVPCRARFDWLPDAVDGQRRILVDYKTTTEGGAAPAAAARSMASYGYHQQGDWYCDAAIHCGLAGIDAPIFLLVFQEKTPPYLVTTYQLPDGVLYRGAERNRKARHVFAECSERGEWPDYGAGRVLFLDLPRWAERDHDAAADRGDFDTGEDL
jgi:hypothetical protein